MRGWSRVRLADVAKVVGGTTPPSDNPHNWNGDVVWITPVDLGLLDAYDINSSGRMITDQARINCGLHLLPPGTVVMSSRAPIGHLGIADTWLCTNQGCKSFIPGPSLDSRFLYFVLRARMDEIRAMGSGATFTEVSKSALERFEIVLPPMPDQHRIAAGLMDELAAAARTQRESQAQATAVRHLRATLTRKAFSPSPADWWPKAPLGTLLRLRNEIVHPRDHPTGEYTFVGLEHVASETGSRIGGLQIRLEHLTGRKARFRPGDIVYGYLRRI